MITKTADDFEDFGRAVWAWVESMGGDIFHHDDSERIMEMAEKAHLVRKVVYDPDKHGDMEASPGDRVWFWGDEPKSEPRPTKSLGPRPAYRFPPDWGIP